MAYRNDTPAPGPWQAKPASTKAIAFLRKLILSASIPARDAERIARYLDSGRATAGRVSAGIDWAKAEIDQRDQAQSASAQRKAQYHQAKANRPFRTAQQRHAVARAMQERAPQPADVLFH